MDYRLQELLELARRVQMTDAERAKQRINFAYANAHFENPRVTYEMVQAAAERLTRRDD